jgi:drug/metabolite transporter (DMT)-like permease
MIAYAAAPALTIAFWRNALAVGVIAPVAATGRRDELRALLGGDKRRTAVVSVLAGVFLAVHFATWVPSAKLTNVAVATALVSTMPVWTAVVAWLRNVEVAGATWLGIGLAVLGVALATGVDVTTSARALTGDALALVGAPRTRVSATRSARCCCWPCAWCEERAWSGSLRLPGWYSPR